MQLPEQYTLRAITIFIEEFLHYTKTNQNLIELIEQNLQNLIQLLLIVGHFTVIINKFPNKEI